jgi:hypothetical protein
MRLVSSWWHGLPGDMQAYCDRVAASEGLTAYDVFSKRNLLDLGAKPEPVLPRLLPLSPRVSLPGTLQPPEPWSDNLIYIGWDTIYPPLTDFVRVLAVEMVEGGYDKNLFVPEYELTQVGDGYTLMRMPKPDTPYTVFLIRQSFDGLVFSHATAIPCVSGEPA